MKQLVKIFESDHRQDVESQINAYLDENQGHTITEMRPTEGYNRYTVLVRFDQQPAPEPAASSTKRKSA